jgi:hypothetical protein
MPGASDFVGKTTVTAADTRNYVLVNDVIVMEDRGPNIRHVEQLRGGALHKSGPGLISAPFGISRLEANMGAYKIMLSPEPAGGYRIDTFDGGGPGGCCGASDPPKP